MGVYRRTERRATSRRNYVLRANKYHVYNYNQLHGDNRRRVSMDGQLRYFH